MKISKYFIKIINPEEDEKFEAWEFFYNNNNKTCLLYVSANNFWNSPMTALKNIKDPDA